MALYDKVDSQAILENFSGIWSAEVDRPSRN